MLTCLIVTLSVTLPTPLKVNATDDNTSKYLYVIGTIAAYAGIDIDVNEVATRFPNFVDEVMALADEIYTEYADTYGWTNDTESGHTGSGSHRDGSDGVIQAANDIQGYLDYLVSGLKPFNPVASLVDYRFVFCLIRAIARWCDENIGSSGSSSSVPSGMSILQGNISTSNGFIDFRTSHSFSLTFPTISTSSNVTSIVEFPLNDCIITYYFFPSYSLGASLIGDTSSSSALTDKVFVVIAPLNSDVKLVYRVTWRPVGISLSDVSGGTFYNRPFFYYDGNVSFGMDLELSSVSRAFPFFSSSQNYDFFSCFTFGGTRCTLNANSSTGFSFKDDSGNVMRNLTFPDFLSALVWFFDQCGIDIRPGSSSAYGAVNNEPPPITIDVTKYEQTITNITNNYQEGDTITMVFPSYYTTNNYYNYDDFREHPEYIFDFNQDGLLNSDFNMPSYDGNILATKFPFCIPFDIIHLFTNFSAEVEAPELHFVVLPANSFNLGNEEFCIDIDFQDYHVIVQLLRFFIAAGFVLWLMVVTNRVLHH